MKPLKYILILAFLTSCGAVVNYDYEKSTDFTQYKTYNYFTDMKTGFSQLDNKRLIRTIDAKLKTMGFTKSDEPNFRIDIQSEEINSRTNSNVGVGVGGTGRNVGGGISIGIPVGINKIQREVIIEFVDDSQNGMFWQAVSSIAQPQKATPEKREAIFIKLIDKIFSKYPPKK